MARMTPRQWRRRYDQPMTLRGIHKKARNVNEYLRWIHGFNGYLKRKDPAKGFRVSENPKYGGVCFNCHAGSKSSCLPGQPKVGCSNHYVAPDETADFNVGPPGTSVKEKIWLTRWERLVAKFTPVHEMFWFDDKGFRKSSADIFHKTHGHASWRGHGKQWTKWRKAKFGRSWRYKNPEGRER